MTITPIQLFEPLLLPDSSTRIYSTPNGAVAVIVKYLEIHNTGTEPVNVTINMVPNNGTPELSNQLYSKPVAGKQTVTVNSAINYNLTIGATIHAYAGTGEVISIHGSGTLIT